MIAQRRSPVASVNDQKPLDLAGSRGFVLCGVRSPGTVHQGAFESLSPWAATSPLTTPASLISAANSNPVFEGGCFRLASKLRVSTHSTHSESTYVEVAGGDDAPHLERDTALPKKSLFFCTGHSEPLREDSFFASH
jgi:hypothetical protein